MLIYNITSLSILSTVTFPMLSPKQIFFPSEDQDNLFNIFFPTLYVLIGISVFLFKSNKSNFPLAPHAAKSEGLVGCHFVS